MTHHAQHPTSWLDVTHNSHWHWHARRRCHHVLHLTHHELLLLLLCEQRITEHCLHIATFFQSVKRAEKHVLYFTEDFTVICRTRRVCEIKRFLNAQCLPVIWIIFQASRTLAVFDGQNAASSDGDSIIRVTINYLCFENNSNLKLSKTHSKLL